MGIDGHLWTICEMTGRSILYEIFGPLTLDFDFSSLKKKWYLWMFWECDGKMSFLFVVTEVGHQGDWSLPEDF